jgi:translation initiation factor IF-3
VHVPIAVRTDRPLRSRTIPAPDFRINQQIRAAQVRLIDEAGHQAGVVALATALQVAADAGLDLVEIAPNETPPVAKVADFGAMKYEASVRARAARKSSRPTVIKEVRLRPAIEEHDLNVKLAAARKFLAHGDRVKISVQLRGRQQSRPEVGARLLREVAEHLSDVATMDGNPSRDGRTMTMLLAPRS